MTNVSVDRIYKSEEYIVTMEIDKYEGIFGGYHGTVNIYTGNGDFLHKTRTRIVSIKDIEKELKLMVDRKYGKCFSVASTGILSLYNNYNCAGVFVSEEVENDTEDEVYITVLADEIDGIVEVMAEKYVNGEVKGLNDYTGCHAMNYEDAYMLEHAKVLGVVLAHEENGKHIVQYIDDLGGEEREIRNQSQIEIDVNDKRTKIYKRIRADNKCMKTVILKRVK